MLLHYSSSKVKILCFLKVQGVKCPKKKFREQKENFVKVQGAKCSQKKFREQKENFVKVQGAKWYFCPKKTEAVISYGK